MARSRAQAVGLIESGVVRVTGIPTPKAASMVAPGDPIELDVPPRFVGRGGEKLEAALTAFGVDPAGRNCLDAGASTGGFTDCLLQHGASRVVALDVGHDQLHESLARRDDVVVADGTNLRFVSPDEVGGPFDLVVGDLSFISLCTVATAIRNLTKPSGDVIMLVKPQFEVGRSKVGKGGIVRDPRLHTAALERVTGCFEAEGLTPLGVVRSPITGAKGNVEFLLWARPGADAVELEYPL